jgi:acetoin utilization protein AcuC
MIPVVYHPHYQRYDFGPEHPFTPARLRMLTGLLDAFGTPFDPVEPPIATRDDLLSVHDEALVEQVEAASRGAAMPNAAGFGLGTMDVPIFAGMDEAARWLVGGTLHAAKLVASGEAKRVLQLGGGLHHAQRDRSSGFCVYNDLAVACRYLQRQDLRVAYIDVDVHHGDGVQAIHYCDEDVLTLSIHESGTYLFPGTGGVHELGTGAATGFSLNVPLEPLTQADSYLDAFERVVPYAMQWFQPDVMVIQCGADTHAKDPLADLLLTTETHAHIYRRLVEIADEYAGGCAVFTLGGGYNADATIRSWTILYHVVNDLPIPSGPLPKTWLDHWQPRVETDLHDHLIDPPASFKVERAEQIAQQNRRNSTRLTEMAVRYWY